MKLGDVLKKERSRMNLSVEDVARKLSVEPSDVEELESGASPAETWGPLLGRIAIHLAVPTSRLICSTGNPADAVRGAVGSSIAAQRVQRNQTTSQIASQLELTEDVYQEIENGKSPVESIGPILLKFAHLVEQPIFNLFYPCGVPLDRLDDYP